MFCGAMLGPPYDSADHGDTASSIIEPLCLLSLLHWSRLVLGHYPPWLAPTPTITENGSPLRVPLCLRHFGAEAGSSSVRRKVTSTKPVAPETMTQCNQAHIIRDVHKYHMPTR